jgi:hypothetical protein
MDKLIQDICEKLPYGLKGEVSVELTTNRFDSYGFRETTDITVVVELLGINIDTKELELSGCDPEEWHIDAFDYCYYDCGQTFEINDFTPYIRPMSSMTDEEKSEYFDMHVKGIDSWYIVDWLNKRYLDYRYLIDKGLAKIAPEGIYK